jgi:cytochrome P450
VSPTAVAYRPLDPGFIASPYETYRRLRDDDPVHHVTAGGHDHWVLSRFEDVFAAARDVDTFSSAKGLSFDGDDIASLGLAPTIVMMDPPDHTAYRRLVSRGFTPRAVAHIEPALRAFVVERIEAMRATIERDGRADFIAELAGPLPSFVVATYLGVPEHDRDRFDAWSSSIVAANASGDVLTGARDAIGELYAYFTDLADRRRVEPGDDMISTLVHADFDGVPLSMMDVLGYAFVMIAGGNDTATGLLGGGADLLSRHPDQRAQLVADPSRIPNAVEELLRLTSPVQGLSRAVTRPVTIRGTDLPAGARVHLLYAAANRDPREFGPTAEDLDVTRSIKRMMSFTSGPHHCLGAAAARLQGRVAFEELLRRLPDFEIDAEAGQYAPGAFVRRFAALPIARA